MAERMRPQWELEEDRQAFEPETVLIPAGPFVMGSSPEQIAALRQRFNADWAQKSEQPPGQITLPAYRIGRFPVTVGEFGVFIQAGGYDEWRYWTEAGWTQRQTQGWTMPRGWDDNRWAGDPRLPVVGVSWYEAAAYCRWLSEMTRRSYWLPTESEWEKAARGTDGRVYPWGDQWQDGLCNTRELWGPGWRAEGRTTPGGSFGSAAESPYGVVDMCGNVWEWCQTAWRDTYDQDENNDPEGEAGRVTRGGAWSLDQSHARTTARLWDDPFGRGNAQGFRVMMVLPGD